MYLKVSSVILLKKLKVFLFFVNLFQDETGRRECSRFKVQGSKFQVPVDFKVLLLLRYRFLFWLYVDFFIYFLLRAKRTGRREKFILTGANPKKSK